MDKPVQKSPESPALLLDASARNVLVGIWNDGQWLSFQESKAEALESIFTGTESVLKQAGVKIKDISSFLYCEGPGSVLGIRISAMALRTWQSSLAGGARPVYAYQSLRVSASLLKSKDSDLSGLVLAPSRMGRWNVLELSGNAEIREIDDAALLKLTGDLYFLDQRGTTEVPVKTLPAPYDLENVPELFTQHNSICLKDQPDAWLPETPEYKKWEPARHGGQR